MSKSTRITEIEQQLAQLRWRRLQNEREIRSALVTTKTMQKNDSLMDTNGHKSADKKAWMALIVEDEMNRPLVLSNADMNKLSSPDKNTSRQINVKVSLFISIYI